MNFLPQRVVSLQPSVTSTFASLGLLDKLVACTRYCVDVVPELRSETKLIVADSWTAKSEELLAAKPDLVIASVPYQLEAVAQIMKAGIAFLGLAPHSLADVYADMAKLAGIMGVAARGDELIEEMRQEIRGVAERASRAVQFFRPTVYCEEWGKPLIRSQEWVAELVAAAGGEFLGTPGAKTDPESIAASNPDVIIAAWCGVGDRVPLERIIESRGWQRLKAVQNGRVYCINDEYLNTPGPTLMQGLHALAAAIHPETCESSPRLRRLMRSEMKSA